MSRQKSIYQLLSTNGDGTGTANANGDYSSTPTSFKISSDEIERVEIWRMLVGIQDTGAFDAAKYGNGVTLTNGIKLRLMDKLDQVIETYTPEPIKSNGGWAFLCHDFNHLAMGTGDEIGTVRWTFTKSGQPIIIDYAKGRIFGNFIKR